MPSPSLTSFLHSYLALTLDERNREERIAELADGILRGAGDLADEERGRAVRELLRVLERLTDQGRGAKAAHDDLRESNPTSSARLKLYTASSSSFTHVSLTNPPLEFTDRLGTSYTHAHIHTLRRHTTSKRSPCSGSPRSEDARTDTGRHTRPCIA